MNHLKHIRINVPRCAASNAALPSHYGHHTDGNFENCWFKSQFLGSNALSVAKKSHGGGVKYSGQFRQNNLRLVSKESKTICKQRSRTKSSVTSLKKKSSFNKKLPLQNTARTVCHYSTCQNVIFNRINKKHVSQEIPMVNSAKNTNRHNSFITSVEKHPRSYAEMIADYSKILYKESVLRPRQNDSDLYFNGTIRMSPFNTFTTSPSAKKITSITEHNRVPCDERKDDSSLPTRRDNTDESHNFQYYDTHTTKATNKSMNQNCIKNDFTGDDQSYVRLVADCNKSMHNISFSNTSNGGLVPKRNVLTKTSLESFATPTRKASSTNAQEALQKTIPLIAAMPLEKNINEQTKEDWLGEMEDVISDLKSFTDRRNAKTYNMSKLEENDISQLIDEFSNSLNGIQRLTEPIETYERIKEDTLDRKLNDQLDKVNKMEKLNKDLDLREHNYSRFNDKTFNATNSASVRKHSTQIPAGDSGSTLKQPQVKLRMVPSEKESIVSINVDSPSTGLLDPQNPVSKQLSVVVQSDRKGDLQSTGNQWNIPTLQRNSKSAPQRSDFGPMRISISEDSAPIKQIEFSINGKPVSELKSITARTDKLDVVSSVDKIEIRIPFAKDEANTLSRSKENDLSKGIDSNTEQILSVQISANFQNKFAKSSTEEPAETTNTISTSPSQTSNAHYVFNKSAKDYDKTFSIDSTRQNESNNTTKKNLAEHKISDNIGFQTQRKTTKKKTSEEANNSEVGKLKKIMNTARSPETDMHDKYESSDSRIPSKMIPWWSSSDSFNKIKKKEGDRKPLTPLSNRNEKKTTSDLKKNLITESSMLKEMSKTPTMKIQSTNNEIITKNNSSNLISVSNSSERCIESKPNLPYSCLFRLKSNRGNPDIIPEIMENNIKMESNQISVVENNEKVSEIKQTKPITISTSDTINMQNKHKLENKAPILSRKFKTPNSAQDSLSKRGQEKEHNYSLKQTKSINEIFTTKIQNNLDVIKSMKKRKDDILIDDAKMSSTKPSTNNRMRKIENSPNFSNSLKLAQTLQNQDKTLQANLKSLSKSNTDRPDTLSSLRISSEKSEKAIELKQNKSNNLSNIKNASEMTMIQKLEKSNLTSPKLKDNTKEFTLHKKIETDLNKSPLKTINEIQTKSSSTSKVKNNVVTKDSLNKNKEKILSTDQSAGKLNKKSDAEITSAKTIIQNPKSKSLLSKDSEENHSRELKTNKDRGSFSGSIGFLKKPSGSAGFISSDSKMHTKSKVISNDNCAYAGKLIMKSSYSSSDRKDNALSNSQRAVFKIPRNSNNVDDILEHHAPCVIGNATPWTNMDRPEKSMLYSAWLQRSRNNINKEKLY